MSNIYIHKPTSQIRELKPEDLLLIIDLLQESRDHQEFDVDRGQKEVDNHQRIIDVLTNVIND